MVWRILTLAAVAALPVLTHAAAQQGGLACGEVLALSAPVLAASDDACRHAYLRAFGAAEFQRDHRVQTGGHDRAGHDAQALARPDHAPKGRTGVQRAHARQQQVLAVCQLTAVEGVAVHRRVVVRWHVDGRDHILGQNPAQAATAWLAIDSVHLGLSGTAEIPGGLWTLLISLAALQRF